MTTLLINLYLRAFTQHKPRRGLMPGRPRSTLKRLDELMERTAAIGDDLFTLMPQQYFERPDPRDRICLGWHAATEAAMDNYRALKALRDFVAEKVGRAERLKGDADLERR
jgi:hypothetical protein